MGDMRKKNSRLRVGGRVGRYRTLSRFVPTAGSAQFFTSPDFVIPSEARDLQFAARCRSLVPLGIASYNPLWLKAES
jgi:hypothetical protein